MFVVITAKIVEKWENRRGGRVGDEGGVRGPWQTGGTPEGDAHWRRLLPPHCCKEKVGLNMTLGSHTQHTHTQFPSLSRASVRPPADIKTFSGHWGLSFTQTHTKTLHINACRKYITDRETALCKHTKPSLQTYATQRQSFLHVCSFHNKTYIQGPAGCGCIAKTNSNLSTNLSCFPLC